jgi:hypothetical protein
MSAGGNLIFFGVAILILDILIFTGTFPSKSLNDPSLHEPFLLLPVIGIVSFVELFSLFLTILGLIMFFGGVIALRRKK